ncbi:MAG: TolC family outer membrane protein [Magnetococcus sp. DMHC-8]
MTNPHPEPVDDRPLLRRAGSRIVWAPLLLWLLAAVLPDDARSAAASPFEQAVQAALESNPKVLTARATLAATREKYEQSLAALLPEVSFTASHARYSDTWTDTTHGQSPDRFNVSLVQPLFRRPLLLALQQTKPLIAAAEEDYHAALQSVLLETIQAMVAVLLYDNVEKLAEDNLVLSHRNLDAAMTRRQAGDLTRTDLDQATARVSSAEAELIRAKNDAMVARARFEETVGMPVPEGLNIPDVPAHLLRGTLADLSRQLAQRPDWKSAKQRLESADVAVEIERAGHIPLLDLQANAVTFRGGSGPTADQINGENQYSIAVQLTVPLFSGGKVFSRTREAVEIRAAREADLQRVEKQATREIKQTYLSMYSAQASVASSEAAFRFYREAVKGLEEEFAAGFRTVTQLFELQNQLFRSKTDLAKNRYELISTQYQLLSTFGRLTLADLRFPDTRQANGPSDRTTPATEGTNLFTRFIDSLKREPATDRASTTLPANDTVRLPSKSPSSPLQTGLPAALHLQWAQALVGRTASPHTAPDGGHREPTGTGNALDLSLTRRILSR